MKFFMFLEILGKNWVCFLSFSKKEESASLRLSFFLEFLAWVLCLSFSFFWRPMLKKACITFALPPGKSMIFFTKRKQKQIELVARPAAYVRAHDDAADGLRSRVRQSGRCVESLNKSKEIRRSSGQHTPRLACCTQHRSHRVFCCWRLAL